jgi:hypothetical protein
MFLYVLLFFDSYWRCVNLLVHKKIIVMTEVSEKYEIKWPFKNRITG